MELKADEFYNGKSLLAGLVNEDIIAYYIYDSDKPEEEKYREISFFLTEEHLIQTIVKHHSIVINKWRRKDITKIKKTYDVMLYNTRQVTNISKIQVYIKDEEIILGLPKESKREKELDNFSKFMQKI